MCDRAESLRAQRARSTKLLPLFGLLKSRGANAASIAQRLQQHQPLVSNPSKLSEKSCISKASYQKNEMFRRCENFLRFSANARLSRGVIGLSRESQMLPLISYLLSTAFIFVFNSTLCKQHCLATGTHKLLNNQPFPTRRTLIKTGTLGELEKPTSRNECH